MQLILWLTTKLLNGPCLCVIRLFQVHKLDPWGRSVNSESRGRSCGVPSAVRALHRPRVSEFYVGPEPCLPRLVQSMSAWKLYFHGGFSNDSQSSHKQFGKGTKWLAAPGPCRNLQRHQRRVPDIILDDLLIVLPTTTTVTNQNLQTPSFFYQLTTHPQRCPLD